MKGIKSLASYNGSLGEQIDYTYHPQLTINTISGLPQYLHHDIVQSTTYDAANRTVQRVLGENALRTSYAYYPWNTIDTGGLLQQILTQTTGGTPTTYQDLRYTQYDRSGNIRTIQDYVTGAPQTQSFEYDNLNRLMTGGASGGGQGNFGPESYNYDSVTGNLSSKAGVSYTYGDQNHKHAVTALSNGNTYSYDANGNMTYRHVYEGGSLKNYILSYDTENRLATVREPVTTGQVSIFPAGGLPSSFPGNWLTSQNICAIIAVKKSPWKIIFVPVRFFFGNESGFISPPPAP